MCDRWAAELQDRLHDALLASFPPEVRRVRWWVVAGNGRGRRLSETPGWTATGEERRTSYPPHPVLLGYARRRDRPQEVSGPR